jgi:hypothetical protein
MDSDTNKVTILILILELEAFIKVQTMVLREGCTEADPITNTFQGDTDISITIDFLHRLFLTPLVSD